MNSTAIYIKTDPEVKTKAQKVAKELGFSLSSLMNAWLRQLIKTKTITFSTIDETPNAYLRGVLKKATENRRQGKASPIFGNIKHAVKYLKQQGI